ncbi:MAG: hypothetical protein OXG47_06585 [bacterium]|nr:hypothetical protein [bacterium]MCY3924472.1 hypothetical protein [bacterium]
MDRTYSGSHERSIDGKWRVSLPPEFRHGADADDRCVLGRVPGSPCLGLWRQQSFDAAYRRLQQEVRTRGNGQNLLRWFSGNGYPVRPDAQGRIVVPEPLREVLAVDPGGGETGVFVAGVGERIELWNADVWLSSVGGAGAYTDETGLGPWSESSWL